MTSVGSAGSATASPMAISPQLLSGAPGAPRRSHRRMATVHARTFPVRNLQTLFDEVHDASKTQEDKMDTQD